VGRDDHARAVREQAPKRRKRRPDPGVVTDAPVREGHVQVRADEHPSPAHARAQQIIEAVDRHRDASEPGRRGIDRWAGVPDRRFESP